MDDTQHAIWLMINNASLCLAPFITQSPVMAVYNSMCETGRVYLLLLCKKKKKNYLVIFFLVDPILHPPGNDVPNFPPRKLDWQGERLWIEHLCTRGGDTERGRVVLLVCQGSLTKQIEMHASSSGGRKKRPS